MTEEEEKEKELAEAAKPEPEQEGVTQPPVDVPEEAPEAPEITEPEPVPEPEPQPRMFSQEEVNALLGKTRMEARQRAREEYAAELRGRYGVEQDSEIDDLIGNGQRFDALNGEYESQSSALNDLKSENALLRSGIPEERFDDVKAILAYSGLEVTPENIANALATHPEWAAPQTPTPPAPVSPQEQALASAPAQTPAPQAPAPKVVPKLGGEPQMARPGNGDDERERIMQEMFGRR